MANARVCALGLDLGQTSSLLLKELVHRILTGEMGPGAWYTFDLIKETNSEENNMKLTSGFLTLALLLTVNANAAEKELKSGQSVVVCASDRSEGSYGAYSGLGELNNMLLSDEVRTRSAGYAETQVVIRAPFAVSAPSISSKDNGNSTHVNSSYKTYCVTVTKQ